MRYIFTLLITAFFIVLVNAQDDVQPYYYQTFTDGDYDLVVSDLISGDILYTVETDGYDCARAMSPDGRYLHYSTGMGSNFPTHQGYLLDIQTGESIEITDLQHPGYWSPDSTQLAFLSPSREEIQTLYVYNLTTTTILEIDNVYRGGVVQWVEDTLIYVTRDENRLTINQWDGEQITPLLEDYEIPQSRFYGFFLSPDASHLLVNIRSGETASGQANYENYLISLATREMRQLDIFAWQSVIEWHPDSSYFVYFSGGRQIVSYSLESDTVQNVVRTQEVAEPSTLQWSPDAQYLSLNQIYAYDMPDTEYWLNSYDVVAQEFNYVGAATYFISGDMRWVSNTQLIYSYSNSDLEFSAEADNLNELLLYDVTTEEETVLTDTEELSESLFCRLG